MGVCVAKLIDWFLKFILKTEYNIAEIHFVTRIIWMLGFLLLHRDNQLPSEGFL